MPVQRKTAAPTERTRLSPQDELAFQSWAQQNRITDVDQAGSFYDYRGYWKEHGNQPMRFGVDHFTDTYKQHGHPTFSQESQYSAGAYDGGMWIPDRFTPEGFAVSHNREDVLAKQPKMAVSHVQRRKP